MSEDTHYYYKRSRFKTRLPRDRKYLKSHYWVSVSADNERLLKIGFTKFSVRMLGEMVDCDYETVKGAQVKLGDVIGWLEGFKATTDIYSVANGEFLGSNPELQKDPELFFKKPYVDGWLYSVEGEMDPEAMDVEAYANYLDETIEKMQGAEA